MLPSWSSQSVARPEYPAGAVAPQNGVVSVGSPNPSASASAYQIGAPTADGSSVDPSQLLSIPSQTSVPFGLAFARESSQSLVADTYPAGASHAVTVVAGSPKPSPS